VGSGTPGTATFSAAPGKSHMPASKRQIAADETNQIPDGYGRNYPFKCDTCGQWHIGRPHKSETLQ